MHIHWITKEPNGKSYHHCKSGSQDDINDFTYAVVYKNNTEVIYWAHQPGDVDEFVPCTDWVAMKPGAFTA